MSSIQRRISFGFYAFAAIVTLLAGLAYSDLRYLEWRINAGTLAGDFLGAVLELRRYEKNYFLYETDDDLQTALSFVDRAESMLRDEPEVFESLPGVGSSAQWVGLIERYRGYLGAYVRQTQPSERAAAQTAVRDLGRELAERAEGIARAERKVLAASVQRTQTLLIVAIGVVVVLGVAAARVLSRSAVRPVAWMESKLAAIGEGRFKQVEPLSQDKEILSMSRATNRMLAEIEGRNRQLVQSEKLASLGTLVSGVAHELNNPLSNVSSSCQILLEELQQGGDVDPIFWLKQIDDESERAKRIVQTLLEFSRDRSFERQWVTVRSVIDKALVLLGRGRRALVEVEAEPELQVFADPQQLQQVLVNLIKNADDAGGAEVNIRIRANLLAATEFHLPPSAIAGQQACPSHAGERVLVIEVEDNGPGIAQDLLNRVFDPFFTTKDVGHGSGLGLYVVQQIVDRHDGCIAVESQPSQGTRFIVCLPNPDGETSV